MKLTTVLCSGILIAAPAAVLAQDKPYPDFDAVAKSVPATESKAAPAEPAKTLEAPPPAAPQAAAPEASAPPAAQPQEAKGTAASPYPDFEAIAKGAGQATESKAEPAQETPVPEAATSPASPESAAVPAAAAAPEAMPPSPAASEPTEAKGGATSYPDFDAIAKTRP